MEAFPGASFNGTQRLLELSSGGGQQHLEVAELSSEGPALVWQV